jgi:hypothetical protein
MTPEIERRPPRRDDLPPRLLPVLYFGAAHLALILAFLAILAQPGLLTEFFYQPRTVAIVHLVTLGWISLSILGALYVIGPMALRTPMPARAADYAAFGMTVVGVVGMIGHFQIGEYGGLAWSAAMVLAGLALVALQVLRRLRQAPLDPPVKAHLVLAFLNVLLAAALGLLVGVHKVRPFLPGSLLAIVYGHAHLAALGWATMMVFGAGYRLLPMLLPAAMPRGPILYATAGLLQAGTIGLVLSFPGGGIPRALASAVVIAAFVVFFTQVRWMMRRPRRPPAGMPRPDYGVWHAVQAMGYAAASAMGGVVLGFVPAGEEWVARLAAAYAACGLLGFLAQMVIGVGARILPMFAAYHANLNACSVRPPTYAHQMPDRRLQGTVFILWTSGVPALVAGLLAGSAAAIAVGAAILLGAALAMANAVIVLRNAFVVPAPVDARSAAG